ncbi:hypothetical protein R50071_19220 [Halioxenophilus aromaticivorans]
MISGQPWCIQQAAAQAAAQVFSEDDLVILDLRYQRYQVGQGLEGYRYQNSVYFALVDIIGVLEMPIELQANSAKGKLNDKIKFSLDYGGDGWQIKVGKETLDLPPKALVEHDGLLYASEQALEQMFKLDIGLKLSDSYATVDSEVSLPFQQSLERRNRVLTSLDSIGEYENPILDVPYSLIEIPSADLRVAHTVRKLQDQDETLRSTFYTLVSNGDLGYMNSNVFVNGSREDGINNVSVRFDRYSAQRDLLGPLSLSQVSFGDIDAPGALSSYGRGVLVSNEAKTSQFMRDFTSIEGNHYPGWEVELLLDDSVIDYQEIGQDGRYRFDDVILTQGNNNYSLVFYGPNGEREVESRNLYVGEDSEDIRKLRYSVSFTQPNVRLYSDNANNNSSIWQANVVSRFAMTNWLSFNAGYSLRHWDELDLSEERLLADDRADEFYRVGVAANILGQQLSVQADRVNDNPFDITYGLGGGRGAFRYRLSYTQFGQQEEGETYYDPLTDTEIDRGESTLEAVIKAKLFGVTALFNGSQINYEDYSLNRSRFIVSSGYNRLNFSTGFEYIESLIDEQVQDQLLGDLFVGSGLGPLTARLRASYQIQPEAELASIGVASSLRLSRDVNVNFDYDHSLLTDTDTYRVGMKWTTPYLTITPSVAYHDTGYVSGNLNVLMPMGSRSGALGNYYMVDRRSISNRGTVKARLFEDENGNGSFDLGERLLSGGVVHSLQTRQRAESDDVGVATLDNVRTWFPSDIVYESDTIDDYSMRYGGDMFAVEARPGKVIEVDLPFYRAGDVDGTVFRYLSDGSHREARGVRIELVKAGGEVVATTVTASDGFYSFERVLPGQYLVRVTGEAADARNNRSVIIDRTGNFVGGVDIFLAQTGSARPGSDRASALPVTSAATPDSASLYRVPTAANKLSVPAGLSDAEVQTSSVNPGSHSVNTLSLISAQNR